VAVGAEVWNDVHLQGRAVDRSGQDAEAPAACVQNALQEGGCGLRGARGGQGQGAATRGNHSVEGSGRAFDEETSGDAQGSCRPGGGRECPGQDALNLLTKRAKNKRRFGSARR